MVAVVGSATLCTIWGLACARGLVWRGGSSGALRGVCFFLSPRVAGGPWGSRRWRRGAPMASGGYFPRRGPKVGSEVASTVGSAVGAAVGSEKTTVYAGDTTNTQAPRLREARRQCSLKTPEGRARRRPRRQPGPGHRRHGQQGRPRVDVCGGEGGLRDDVHGDQRALVCSRRPSVSHAPSLASGLQGS